MKNKHKKEDIAELGVFSIRINSDKINEQLLYCSTNTGILKTYY